MFRFDHPHIISQTILYTTYMKFIKMCLSFLVFISFTVAFTACNKRKNWSCTCTYKDAGIAKSRNFSLDDRTKSDAEDNCNTSLVSGPDVTDANCTVKEKD